jgi:iron complex transport system substrate-binding protein
VAGELVDAYPAVSPEKVLQWNPDVILLAYMSRGGTGAEALAGRIGWRDLPAVKQGRVIDDIPADWLLRPGPRMVEGAKVLARRLHAMYVDYPAAADRRGP